MPRLPTSPKGLRISVALLACGLCAAFPLTIAAAAPIKVACIGEHTTHSHAFPADNREAQPVGMQEYPAQLQTLLGAGYQVRNFGDCCASVLQGYTVAETHPYVDGTNAGDGVGYKESIAFLPDVVVIGSWGRHDWGLDKAPGEIFTLQGFQDGYDDLVKRYQALPSHPKIFVSLPIPILNGQGDVPDEGVKTSDVLPAVNAIAAKYKLPIVDMYTPFLNHMEFFKQPPDAEGEGEHTAPAGITAMANAVYAAIQKDLAANASGSGGMSGSGGTSASGGTSGSGVGGSSGGNSGSSGETGGMAAGVSGSGGASGASVSTSGSGGLLAAGGAGTAGQVGAGGESGASVVQPQAGANSSSSPSAATSAGCGCKLAGRGGGPSRVGWLLGCVGLFGVRRRVRRVSSERKRAALSP